MSESIIAIKWLWSGIFAPVIWYVINRGDRRYDRLERRSTERYNELKDSQHAHTEAAASKFGSLVEAINNMNKSMGKIEHVQDESRKEFNDKFDTLNKSLMELCKKK